MSFRHALLRFDTAVARWERAAPVVLSQFNTLSLHFNFRYIAVHNPIDYKQAVNDSAAINRRLVKYLLPVLVASIIFNLPKFFEATYHFVTTKVHT